MTFWKAGDNKPHYEGFLVSLFARHAEEQYIKYYLKEIEFHDGHMVFHKIYLFIWYRTFSGRSLLKTF